MFPVPEPPVPSVSGMAAKERLAEVVARHAPVLHMHPRDMFMPSTVEWFSAPLLARECRRAATRSKSICMTGCGGHLCQQLSCNTCSLTVAADREQLSVTALLGVPTAHGRTARCWA